VVQDTTEWRAFVNTVMTIWKDSWLVGQFTRKNWRHVEIIIAVSAVRREYETKGNDKSNYLLRCVNPLLYTLAEYPLSEEHGTLTYNRPT
jgi:hypothetical protein